MKLLQTIQSPADLLDAIERGEQAARRSEQLAGELRVVRTERDLLQEQAPERLRPHRRDVPLVERGQSGVAAEPVRRGWRRGRRGP